MITRPSKGLCHRSHSCHYLFLTGLSHALQHLHLLLFDSTVYHKVIEIRGAHGQPFGTLLYGTATKQAYSDNARAKHVGETLHDYVHMLAPILKHDEE